MLWLAVIAAASVFIFIGVVYSTSMPGTSHSGPLPPLTDRQRDVATRLERHVATRVLLELFQESWIFAQAFQTQS